MKGKIEREKRRREKDAYIVPISPNTSRTSSTKASTSEMRWMVAANGEHTGARAGTEAGDAVAIGFQGLVILST